MPLRKTKEILLSLNHLRKATNFSFLAQAVRTRTKLDILDVPPKGRVLILSPHPDDDAFGCGGTIALHQKQNDEMMVVYLCNGGKGGEKPTKDLIETRQGEARRALEFFGIAGYAFWGVDDGTLGPTEQLIQKMKEIIEEYRPALVYVPALTDPHPDHQATNQIFAEAIKKLRWNGMTYSYEIWSPIFANRLIKIDETVDKKRSAMLYHKSQLGDRSYYDAMLGLNAYRAGMFKTGKYAEGYFAASSELYLQLYNLLYKHS